MYAGHRRAPQGAAWVRLGLELELELGLGARGYKLLYLSSLYCGLP